MSCMNQLLKITQNIHVNIYKRHCLVSNFPLITNYLKIEIAVIITQLINNYELMKRTFYFLLKLKSIKEI